MRIIAGAYRSVALASVGKGDVAGHLRPTTDRVRESLFNVLAQYDPFEGARVLDLFAGTGALGLEALSRGAEYVTFVDDGRVAQKIIAQNVSKLQVRDKAELLRTDARRLPSPSGPASSLIFLDPPYGKDLGTAALLAADSAGWVASEALVVWEEAKAMTAPEGFDVLDRRKYGDTHITLLSKQSDQCDSSSP